MIVAGEMPQAPLSLAEACPVMEGLAEVPHAMVTAAGIVSVGGVYHCFSRG